MLILLLTAVLTQSAPRVAPAERRCVTGETLKLAAEAPRLWSRGTVLEALAVNTKGIVPAPDAFDAKSLVVKHGGRTLELGQDYLVDAAWGTLGLAPGSRVTINDTVSVDYCYSLRRVDTLVRERNGQQRVIAGVPEFTDPKPPAVPAGARAVANLFVNYFNDGQTPDVFPIEKSKPPTLSAPGRVPKTLAKLKAGQPVRIVSWGDSVTTGADVTPQESYTAVFESLLRARYPKAQTTVTPIAVGGSHSRQWLYPDQFTAGRLPKDELRWQRVIDAKPDLVTIEFVNDASMKPEDLPRVYGDILQRLQTIGAEVIFITPHFTMLSMMKFSTLRDREQRPYVLALREFAKQRGVALADAAARWEHLWREGIPYVTLLKNGINHPDARGHRLFAEELLRCF